MDVFGDAVAAVFADPNFGKPAVYRPPGGGGAVDIAILFRQPDAVFDQAGSAAVGATASGEIRVADLPSQPLAGGTVTLADGGAVYRIASARRGDADRSIWLVTFGAAK